MKIVRRFVRTGEPALRVASLNRAVPKILLGGLIACLVISVVACKQAPLNPVDITERDVCFRCKEPIADKHYAAELITKDGFVRKFNDIGCMLEHAKTKIGRDNIAAYYAMDFPTQKWLKAEEAHYVKSDKFTTPKNGGILAFKDAAQAQAAATQYQAQLLKFSDLIQ
jgi:nitrous oxide reductase accessory protein NosL